MSTTQYTPQQEMLVLAFVSYLGFADTAHGEHLAEEIFHSIREGLQDASPVAGEWEILWGPALYRPLTIFVQNLMFLVRSKSNPARYAIVIRGTNPVSPSNWILEDFAVVGQVRWPYYRPHGLRPKMSRGTARGLSALQTMKPEDGVPGAGTNLYQFLASEVMRNPARQLSLSVTGHSLGGALSPAVALWLADTQTVSDDHHLPPWDPQERVTIDVHPFAGPSPGNIDFARYYDEKLGHRTHRTWNPFDVVPHGWVEDALDQLPQLYGPSITPSWWLKLVLWSTTLLAWGGDYLQITAQTPALSGGEVTPLLDDYFVQMLYQHTAAYLALFKMQDQIDATRYFQFDDDVRAKIQAATGRPPTAPAAPAPKLADRLSDGVRRVLQVPATVLPLMLPESVTLSDLNRRKVAYEHAFRLKKQESPAAVPSMHNDVHVEGG